MYPKQQIPRHPKRERANQQLFQAAVLEVLKTTPRVKRQEFKEKDGGFCFTVNKASTPLLLVSWFNFWLSAGPKTRAFPPIAKTDQGFDLTLTSIIFLVSTLPLISQHSLTVTRMPIEYSQEYLTLSLSRLCVIPLLMSSKQRKDNSQPYVSWIFFALAQKRWKSVLSILFKSPFSVFGS